MTWAERLGRVVARQDLSADEMRDVVSTVMRGEAGDAELAALLTALRMKGETVAELVGASQAMAAHATRIPASLPGLLDTCGTGGDGWQTFNISTAAALVAAGAGVPVAKHGNRSVSSRSGSADVLEALGVNLQLRPEQIGECIRTVGLGFCFAPVSHGSMKHAAAVRRRLGFRTIFNLLGPLNNPAGAEFQLLGAFSPASARLLAGARAELGTRCTLVVCGEGGLDEVALWGHTVVHRVTGQEVTDEIWSAADFGLPECRPEALAVEDAQASAEVIRNVLRGTRGPHRDIVLANAAAALLAAQRVGDLREGVALAARAVDSGAAAERLAALAAFGSS